MKTALAILGIVGAFTSAASAQTSVTLYGLVDLNYQYVKSDTGHQQRLSDGSFYGPGSRWGVRVLEDLGGGLRASAVLEQGFSADSGALGNGGRGFGRQSYVSLGSTKAGDIRLGRQFSLHDEVMSLSNPFGSTTVLNPGAVSNTLSTGAIPLFIDAVRLDNMVQYISPSFNGFKLQAAVALGEDMVDRYQGLKGSYTRSPLNVAMSYEWSKARLGTAGVSAPGDTVNKIMELSANYDFSILKVFGGYQRGKDLTTGSGAIITGPVAAGGVGSQLATLTFPGLRGPATDLTAYTVGASVPIGVTTLGVNYTRAKYGNTTGNRTLGRIALAATYAFSKQTLMYGGVGVHNGDLKNAINEKTIYQIGLRKAF
jgi:GBP family porin